MRTNTQLEAAGAEHLVLGNLLRMRIQSFITTQNFENYDIIATNPESGIAKKIQVKSRYGESDNAFPISKFNSDFVVFVRLNCVRRIKNKPVFEYRKQPEFYVFPTKVVEKYNRRKKLNKFHLIDLPDSEYYKDNWVLIKKALKM